IKISTSGGTDNEQPPPSQSLTSALTFSERQSVASSEGLSLSSPEVLECVFLHALGWAFTSVVEQSYQRAVDAFIKTLSGLQTADEGPENNVLPY
ncbi:unnamed protein product, partial [Trichobilharzia szidati]